MTTDQTISALRSLCSRTSIVIDPLNPDDPITHAITVLEMYGVDSQEYQLLVRSAEKVVRLHVDLILSNVTAADFTPRRKSA